MLSLAASHVSAGIRAVTCRPLTGKASRNREVLAAPFAHALDILSSHRTLLTCGATAGGVVSVARPLSCPYSSIERGQ
jgi:hypothetical protein